MNISVVGTGYVGLVVGACLAETGNNVCCADIDKKKIGRLKKNDIPIYEPGLEPLVERNQKEGRLSFTTDIQEAVASAEVLFIAVGTPPGEDGGADLKYVLQVASLVGRHMTREMVVVTKSTVPVGSAAKVAAEIAREAKFPFHICSNPEFLKEGDAVEDFMRPDRVVLGAESAHARKVISDIYAPFVRTGKPILLMDIASAEMTKYAANGMLATRISFMNEIANLCDKVGANVDFVRRGIGSDSRIGQSFLFPGPGYGGSCFPKDVSALKQLAGNTGYHFQLLTAVIEVNELQKRRVMKKLEKHLGSLVGKRVALLGLAFKPDTDDMREATSLVLASRLQGEGASVSGYDPVAERPALELLPSVEFCDSPEQALEGADAAILVTEWPEFAELDWASLAGRMANPLLIDGRNFLDPQKLRAAGFAYEGIGRQNGGGGAASDTEEGDGGERAPQR